MSAQKGKVWREIWGGVWRGADGEDGNGKGKDGGKGRTHSC